jgi:hypothetical protein
MLNCAATPLGQNSTEFISLIDAVNRPLSKARFWPIASSSQLSIRLGGHLANLGLGQLVRHRFESPPHGSAFAPALDDRVDDTGYRQFLG